MSGELEYLDEPKPNTKHSLELSGRHIITHEGCRYVILNIARQLIAYLRQKLVNVGRAK